MSGGIRGSGKEAFENHLERNRLNQVYEEQDQFPDRRAQFQPSNLSTRESEAEYYADERDVDQDASQEELMEREGERVVMERNAVDVDAELDESVNRTADLLSGQEESEQVKVEEERGADMETDPENPEEDRQKIFDVSIHH